MTARASPPARTVVAPESHSEARRAGLGFADCALAVLVGGAAATLYVNTLAPGLLGGDSGEFQFAAFLGGIAHPTGYPLYLILGHLWTHLIRSGDPAWRMNLLSAVWGGIAVGLLYLLAAQIIRLAAGSREGVRAWTIRLPALSAALLFAVTPTFWSQAVIAEVYTLHAALLAAVLLGLVTWQANGRASALYFAGLAFGLGLAHHRTVLLLVPAIVLFVWYQRRSGGELRPFVWVRTLLLALTPTLLYAYIPLRGPRTPYADIVVGQDTLIQLYQPTLGWLLQHISGSGFSSALRSPVEAAGHLGQSAAWLLTEFSWVGIVLGLVGAAWLLRRVLSLALLTGAAFLTFAAFNLFYGIGDIHVFHIPLYLVWDMWVGVGVAAVAWTLLDAIPHRRVASGLAVLVCGTAFALPAVLLLRNYRLADQSGNDQMARAWHSILAEPIAPGAILVSNDRDEMTPLWYLQYVEGARTDLTGIFPLIEASPEWANIAQVIDASRRSGRPIFLVKEMPGLEVKFRAEPDGALWRIEGPAVTDAPGQTVAVSYADTVRLLGYDADPGLVGADDALTISLHWQPLRQMGADYTTFVHVLNADGVVIGQSDHKPGGDFYPTSLWRPGELLKDTHQIAIGPEPGRPPYTLEVGLYRPGDTLEHLGQPQRVGQLGHARPADALPADDAREDRIVFGDVLTLLSHEMTLDGDLARVRLYWQAVGAPARDYTVFVHLVDEADQIVAQIDRPPLDGEMPTSTWPAGYVAADEMTLALPEELTAGDYRLLVGLYDATTSQRLTAMTEDGVPLGDAVPLDTLEWPVMP
jgi:hypothetical protein